MARRVRTLYRWNGRPDERSLEHHGWISEASLRAWEYHRESEVWEFAEGDFHDVVRRWRTTRPDLHIPEELLVGDHEELAR